jgi:hypothetical protein
LEKDEEVESPDRARDELEVGEQTVMGVSPHSEDALTSLPKAAFTKSGMHLLAFPYSS